MRVGSSKDFGSGVFRLRPAMARQGRLGRTGQSGGGCWAGFSSANGCGARSVGLRWASLDQKVPMNLRYRICDLRVRAASAFVQLRRDRRAVNRQDAKVAKDRRGTCVRPSDADGTRIKPTKATGWPRTNTRDTCVRPPSPALPPSPRLRRDRGVSGLGSGRG